MSDIINLDIQHLKREPPAVARFVLRNIRQRDQESVQEFAEKILKIAKLGYIRVSDELLQLESIDAFVKGCRPRCTLYDHCRYPCTLVEVVRDVLQEKIKPKENEIQTENTIESISHDAKNEHSREISRDEFKHETSLEPITYETENEISEKSNTELTEIKETPRCANKKYKIVKSSGKLPTKNRTATKEQPKLKEKSKVKSSGKSHNRNRKATKQHSKVTERSNMNSHLNFQGSS